MLYRGIGASPGIALGKAYVFDRGSVKISEHILDVGERGEHIDKLDEALKVSKDQLLHLKRELGTKMDKKDVQIFEAHIMLLEDPLFIYEIKSMIEEQGLSAEHAVSKVSQNYINLFENLEDEYMRERAADIKDISDRLIKNLLGIPIKTLSFFKEDVVVISRDLSPSDTAQMSRDHVLAFATDTGAKTSHSAIMARSLQIPAVVGLVNFSQRVSDGDMVIVDGNRGRVYLRPNKSTIERYREEKKAYLSHREGLKGLKDLPAETEDKSRKVELQANIGTPADAASALEHGAEGVGLYRTEFLYMDRQNLPSEEEQFEAYREVVQAMGSKPVTIRTLDIGGDKELSYLKMPREMNPFLGYRAIRLCLDRPDIFKTQLRAILRASAYGKIRIMYPMISSLSEILEANTLLSEVKSELREESIPFDAKIEVGIMVEIPSVAVMADTLAARVDFFSIGTNDLIQYTLAVDRMNEHISHLYEPFHPAVIRLIRHVIDASHRAGKWTGMCGEMAGDASATALLLGLGLDEFSMSSPSIPLVKEVVRSLTFDEAKALADKALKIEEPEEIKALMG